MCSCQEIYAFKYARKDRLQSYRCKLNIALKTEIITKQKANGIDGKWNTFQVSDLSVIVRENQTDLKKANGRGSAKLLHTNIIASLGGLMHKYTKQSSWTVFVLEIQVALCITPSGAIFISKFY